MTLNAYYASQNCMNETIKAIFKEIFKKIAKCARFYEINRNILSKRLYEKSFRSARIAFNKRFIDAEKHFLMIYIQYYDKKNLSTDDENYLYVMLITNLLMLQYYRSKISEYCNIQQNQMFSKHQYHT